MFGLNNFDIILLLTALTHLLLAVAVYFKAPKSNINRLLAIFLISLSGWIFSNFMIDFTRGNPAMSLFWARGTAVAVSFLAPSFFAFTIAFPKYGHKLNSKIKILTLSAIGILGSISLTPLVVESVNTSVFPVELVRGSLYFVLIGGFLGFLAVAILNLFSKYRNEAGLEKDQIKFIFIGMCLSVGLSLATNLILPSFGFNGFVRIGPVSTLILAGFTTYAIVRYRLLDVRLAFRLVLIKILVAATFGAFFYIIYLSLNTNRIAPTSENIVIILILVSITLAFSVQYVEKWYREITSKFLFQKEYSHQELLRDLGRIVSQSLELDEVLKNIQDTLVEVMRVEYVGFVIWSDRSDGSQELISHGKQKDIQVWGFDNAPMYYEWKENDTLAKFVEKNAELLVFDELVREVSELDEENEERSEKEILLEQLRVLNAGVIMPLPASEGVTGFAVLGEKKGGDAFSSGDINTLETLMFQAGIAIENASLYTRVQQFNQKLRQEIAKATDDLARKNESLTILRHIDQVIISSLGIEEMAQKIVDTISWELGYKGGFIILKDNMGENLRAVALSNIPHYNQVHKLLPIPITDYKLPMNSSKDNFLIKAVKERKKYYTTDFKDIYVPAVPEEFAHKLQETIQSKYSLIYPLEAKGEVLGVIIFDLIKPFDNFNEDEKSLLDAFMDEAGIAINNAMLYEELQEVNNRLKFANQRLRELDQMKDELVSVASHELRTPMTAIKGYLWMALNKQGDTMNEKLKEYLSRSYQSTERLIEMVNDMLSVSRLEGKRITLEPKEIDISEMMEGVLFDLTPKAEEKGLELSYEKPKDEIIAMADETRLREILINLVGNALKYTHTGKVWVNASIVEPRQEGLEKPMVQIDIHDTGQGIAEDDMPKLFTKFGKLTQGSFVKSAEEGGTGLGLYIAKGMIELHGGKIWVESVKDKGSTFSFTIPKA